MLPTQDDKLSKYRDCNQILNFGGLRLLYQHPLLIRAKYAMREDTHRTLYHAQAWCIPVHVVTTAALNEQYHVLQSLHMTATQSHDQATSAADLQ